MTALREAAVLIKLRGSEYQLVAELTDADATVGPASSPADANGGQPAGLTIAAYEALREENPQANWPPASSVRRCMGGRWNDALRRARLPTVNDGDAAVRFNGPKFRRQESVDAIQACVADIDECISLTDDRHWVRRPPTC